MMAATGYEINDKEVKGLTREVAKFAPPGDKKAAEAA